MTEMIGMPTKGQKGWRGWESAPMCRRCWDRENPGRLPIMMVVEEDEVDTCCICFAPTTEGIFVRKEVVIIRRFGTLILVALDTL